MRRGVGIAAVVIGLLALVTAVLSVTGGRSFMHPGLLFASPPLVRGERSISLTAGTVVSVNAAAARVTVQNGPAGRLGVRYDLPRGSFYLRQSGAGVSLGDAGGSFNLDMLTGTPTLTVTVPAGTVLSVTSAAGPITVRGTYSSMTLNATAGPVALEQISTASLRVATEAGPFSASFVSAPRRVSVQDTAGSILVKGPWARNESLHDTAGSITMNGRPVVRTDVSVTVSAGQLNSSVAGIGSGGNGTFTGTVGSGSGLGRLTITADAGSVTLNP
ncbi:MAG: hypothetical protein ACP5QO_16905 [Clostridia bacterium]